MALPELLQVAVIGLYGAAAMLFLAGTVFPGFKLRHTANVCAVAGFGLHTLDLVLGLIDLGAESLTAGNFYYSLLAWSLVLIFFFLWWRLKLGFLAITASPLALILYVSSHAVQGIKVLMPKTLSTLFFGLHIGTLFVSMALLAMAFGAGLAFLYLDKRIKSKAALAGMGKDMPSLWASDTVNHWAIVAGFPLYTLGLLSGFIWARLTWGRIFSWDPKEVVALAVWLLFAFLFHHRLAMGWRGRKPAIMAILVFAVTVASLVGINFLLPTHHSFKP